MRFSIRREVNPCAALHTVSVRSIASMWKASAPTSASDSSYRSSISLDSVPTSACSEVSDAGVSARTPSSSASSSPRRTASGVRSSCEMSAVSWRRIFWLASSVSASRLKSPARWPISSRERTSTRAA